MKSAADLEKLKGEILGKRDPKKPCISICAGTGCLAVGADGVVDTFKEEIEKRGLNTKVDLKATGCPGFCERGPLVVIYPEGVLYQRVQAGDVPEIVSQAIGKGKIVDRLLYVDPVSGKKIVHENEIPFYKAQLRLLLGNNTKIDATSIDDYLALGGYSALAKVLSKMSPVEVIDEVKKANPRGRGGGGFPAGRKWESCRNAPGKTKYVIVNCDEGDPGAFMDRAVMEGNPHSVLEGLIIGGYAIGSNQGYVYVREEYPLAVENTLIAIKQAEEYGLLGKNILGSGFDFRIDVHRGAGAFVSGESSALMTAIEGRVGEPRPKYIRSVVSGIRESPSNLNNVETWANIPLIINKGADWYSSIGTEKSKGTKIFALVGKVNNTGLVEVPMGITLRDIIYGIGGGIPKNKKFKAVQTGGPSGGCLPEEYLDTPVDFDGLTKLGSMMGSGGMIVMDEDTCMVDVAKFFVQFLADEGCGKCVPCREGLKQMNHILTEITEGRGKPGDIELLEELSEVMIGTALCALGTSAPNPVLSTLKYFREEYEEHIKEKRCRGGFCKALVKARCMNSCPLGTDVPRYVGLISEGKFAEAAVVIREKNPFPSICGRVCFCPCEARCRRGEIDDPVAIKYLKRFALEKEGKFKGKGGKPTGKRVAIVGAGPAGLTAGYYLAKLGHAVCVFEAESYTGGMLRTGIPDFYLPKDVLDEEIENIKSVGVEIKLNSRVEKLSELFEAGYNAVFVAVGAQRGVTLPIPGADLKGVIVGLDFLRDVNTGKEVKIGKNVLVLGGGNVACDVARVARRLGAAEVHMACPESRQTMPALPWEIEAAEAEGIIVHPSHAFTKILGKDGNVTGVECLNVRWMKFDKEGKLHLDTVKGSESVLSADTVIFAVGQKTDLACVSGTDKVEITKRNTIAVTPETLATGHPGVFAGGDAVSGPASATEAIAAGRNAAVSIDKFLGGKGIIDEVVLAPEKEAKQPDIGEEGKRRVKMPSLPVNKRLKCFKEVELGFNKRMAIEEAKRCLRCDLEEKEE